MKRRLFLLLFILVVCFPLCSFAVSSILDSDAPSGVKLACSMLKYLYGDVPDFSLSVDYDPDDKLINATIELLTIATHNVDKDLVYSSAISFAATFNETLYSTVRNAFSITGITDHHFHLSVFSLDGNEMLEMYDGKILKPIRRD